MIDIDSIAEEIAEYFSAKSLGQVSDAATRKKIYAIAAIVGYYREGKNPERWLGQTEELLIAKKFLKIPTIEEQKKILVEKGLLREPGDEGPDDAMCAPVNEKIDEEREARKALGLSETEYPGKLDSGEDLK